MATRCIAVNFGEQSDRSLQAASSEYLGAFFRSSADDKNMLTLPEFHATIEIRIINKLIEAGI